MFWSMHFSPFVTRWLLGDDKNSGSGIKRLHWKSGIDAELVG